MGIHSGHFSVALVLLSTPLTLFAGGVPTIQELPPLYSDAFGVANAISADGTTVGGFCEGLRGAYIPVRWTSSGVQTLGTFGGTSAGVLGLNADGNVAVGYATNSQRLARAFRWTSASGMQDLGTLGGAEADAYGANADGSIIVGISLPATGTRFHGFRWTSAGMTDLGTLPSGGESQAVAISGDGSTVVGLNSVDSGRHAVRWTSGGIQDLGTLGGLFSNAQAVSTDGSVVVGSSTIDLQSSSVERVFRWTQAGGMQLINGSFGGGISRALAVSGDGSMIVGVGTGSAGDGRAFLWSQSLGFLDLKNYLSSRGVDMTGWTLSSATGISADGTSIAGYGIHNGYTRAFLVRTVPAPGVLVTGMGFGGVIMRRRRSIRGNPQVPI